MANAIAYFSDEVRSLTCLSVGAITIDGEEEGEFEAIFYPSTGALEVVISKSFVSVAWQQMFIEDQRLPDKAAADQLLAICDGILANNATVHRTGNAIRRKIETTIPLKTRGVNSFWSASSVVYLDFGRKHSAGTKL